MSKAVKVLRKNRVLNALIDKLFFIKKQKIKFQARDLRRTLTDEAMKMLEKRTADKYIFMCGVPTHRNMGDQAQRYCIRQWCLKNYPEYEILEIPTWPFYERRFKTRLIDFAKRNDIFVIQSGYCTTSRHRDHDMHRFVVKSFQDNKILIMPQTVNYQNKKDGYKTGEIYNRHKRLLFLARDKTSYEFAKRYFNATEVRLFPDIVTTLIGTMHFDEDRSGVLICVRNDGEKKYSNESVAKLKEKLQALGETCDISDTNSDLPLDVLVRNFESELKKTLTFFAKYKLVITDRYHGTIFAMITNTPVIVLATNDHKVKTGTEWFKGVYDGAFFNAESMEDAFTLAQNILGQRMQICNEPYFEREYYCKLKEIFENTEGYEDE